MERVTGIGGFFFRAKDPAALGLWYDRNLGVAPTPTDCDAPSWHQEPGPTVFEPFPEDTGYFRDDGKAWMFTLRVGDLDALVAQLRRARIEVEVDPVRYPNGRFARLADPEGNPLALWQPMGRDPGAVP